ncbi:MAG: glycosyltransferase [Flavobacteriales bacterium]|nr:glycosyltransferase [Flavobacteriales bacterium]|tara:strand:+ start:16543 stop:17790 length:1248 start_codon:yes stop_codon:yes gene_type:complete
MEPIRVLFISYDGLTDPLGQSQVLPYLVKLSELNYKITVVSTEKEKNFLKNRVTIDSICKNAGIDWEFIFYTKNPPIFSTIRDVSNLKKKVNELYKRSEFQIVHCRSYIAALTGMYIKRKFKTKFLFDMRGFWADERVDGGIWNLNNPVFKLVYNFFKTKEKAYFLSADAAVSLTYNGKKEIVSWDYMRHAKYEISVIPCCADLNYFNYREIDENISVKYELGISLDNKVICYLGSTGTWYMIDEMLDYFKIHLEKYPKTTFLWITKDNPNDILQLSKERGIDSKVVIKGVERKELPQLLSICDASIFFIKPLYSKKASSPTKMAELLGMGIPLICNTGVGDTDEIVEKEKVGLVAQEFTEKSYRELVESFDKLLNIPKSQLRSVAQKYFSLDTGVKQYEAIYKKIIADYECEIK